MAKPLPVFPKGVPALQRKTIPTRLKYGKYPHELGILCRHRRAKTRRLGLCPRCYEAYMKIVNPQLVERKNERMRAAHHANREKRIAVSRARAVVTPTWKVRDSGLRRAYGVTVFQYNLMAEQQGHACKICGAVPNRRLGTDHDHKTGRVRGLLCWRCNRGLELFSDNPDHMWEAVRYLASTFDGRHLKVERRNVIVDLAEKAIAAGEPVRIQHKGKALVVMTAETYERMNGSAESLTLETQQAHARDVAKRLMKETP